MSVTPQQMLEALKSEIEELQKEMMLINKCKKKSGIDGIPGKGFDGIFDMKNALLNCSF